MTEIDRRALIGVAGAGLVLAGCKDTHSKTGKAVDDQICFELDRSGGKVYTRGTYPSYEVSGINEDPVTHYRTPYGAKISFEYHYVCLVYLKFGENGLTAKHAHFDKPDDSIIKQFIQDNFVSIRNSKKWKYLTKREGENFDEWGFGSPSLIYFFLDNNSSYKFDTENLIQFSPYSARLDINGGKIPKDRNNAFLNPNVNPHIWYDHEIMTLENWYVDEKGSPIDKNNYQNYSMNIYLRAGSITNDYPDGFNYAPIVIDPDTGNMGSDP